MNRRRLSAVTTGLVTAGLLLAGCTHAQPAHFVPAGAASSKPPSPTPTASRTAPVEVTLSAVGDTIMADAPSHVAPHGGVGFFDDVEAALRADLQMANLEEPLTTVATSTKCAPEDLGKDCFAFRGLPSYADVLHDAGFDLVNLANNHALDFGPAGHTQTEHALTAAGIAFTGPPGMITTVRVKGLRIAVVGFAPYAWANNLLDTRTAKTLVRKAKAAADLVVIQVHMGGEGPSHQHVTPGHEIFLGEDRGDPIAFSHAMIDAGADIVIGHSPHVLRGLEFYKGRLIAYSLGNFAGYHALSTSGVMGVSMVLRVTLRADGTFVGGSIVPTSMVAPGLPRMDPKGRAIPLVASLTRTDFPKSGAQIAPDGTITAPSA